MKKITNPLAFIKALAMAIPIFLAGQMQAQVTNVNTAAVFANLQTAINDPGTLAGHTLILTANLTEGLVNVHKALTIDGQGFTLTSTSPTYGINPTIASVSIEDITITAAGTFGIHATCGTNNLALTNVTVNACGGSGITINGSDNCLFTNITCTNNNGNGMSVTNCDNMSVVGFTSSGNSFGGGFGAGIGIFTSSVFCLPAGVNGFSLTGTVTIAENPRVYSQKASTADVITGITGPSIEWAVGTSLNDRSYWPSKPIAYSVVDALFEPPYSFPNTAVFVEEVATDNLYVDDNPNGDATPPMLVNTAIAAAQVGKTIFLEAGTYAQRVVINKSLTIDGDAMTTSVLDGTGLVGTGSGIAINNNITNVTVRELTVRNYALGSSNDAGIVASLGNNNLTIFKCEVHNNGGGRGGVYVNGPVNNVLIDSVKAHDHPAGSRGIVVWNGLKQNVTIQNCEVYNNNCCGIEFQDGTASGINVLNNNVYNNADNGIGLNGLKGGTGANLVSGNTVANNGRFGIEVKNANTDGTNAGINSFLITGNTVSLTPTVGMNNRDHAGISVYRRAFQSGNPDGYPDVPTGVVITGNTISGFQQLNPGSTESKGYGIVVEGTNHEVTNNTINNSDIGIQEQGGAHPNANYVNNNLGDANQTDGFSANYFGRGNAPVACGNLIGSNIFAGNTTNQNTVIAATSLGLVTNTNTGETFCSIQDAINDAQTLNGHTIVVAAGNYPQNLTVTKSLTILGPNAGINACSGTRVAEAVLYPSTADIAFGEMIHISAPNVTIDGFTLNGDNPAITSGFTSTNGADIDAAEGVTVYEDNKDSLTVQNNIFKNLSYYGVTIFGDYNLSVYPPSTGHVVTNNSFMDFGTYDPLSGVDYWGGGVILYNNNYASVTNNCMTNLRLGVQTGNNSQANPGTATYQNISNNTIQIRSVGVFHNLHYNAASPITIANNTITGLANANETFVNGLLLGSLSVNSFCNNNNINLTGITSGSIGYEVWNVAAATPATITGGNISNVDYGLFINNYDGYNSNATFGGHAVATQLYINPNATGYGAYVKDNTLSTHVAVSLNLTNSFISGGAEGVYFENAAVSGPINNNHITGNSNKSINATAYTGVPPINATCNWYGSAIASTVANEVAGNVTYINYLIDGTDNDLITAGFQPAPTACAGLAVTLTMSATAVNCFNGTDGTATVTVNTGITPFTYLWNNGQTTATATGLAAGNYTVTVTDSVGSTAIDSVMVTQPANALSIVCSSTNVSCFNAADGTASVVASNGTAPYTYLWSNGNTNSTIAGLVPGSYTVTVTDANGCTSQCSVTITQPAEILVTISKNETACAGGGTTANICAAASNGVGPFTYLWSNAATTPCINDVAAGTYNVVVTNTANGCTKTVTVVVN